jgi:hypothetical protein
MRKYNTKGAKVMTERGCEDVRSIAGDANIVFSGGGIIMVFEPIY